MKILHLLSQRPDATGSGIYLQAMLRESAARRHQNFLVAGLPSDHAFAHGQLSPDNCLFVRFEGQDLPFPIVGMSDIMPYRSMRFRDLGDDARHAYEQCFAEKVQAAVECFRPDVVHSHHLWLMTAVARRRLPTLPMVATCHSTDLRQFQNCPRLQARVGGDCRRLDAVMALSAPQKSEIEQRYGLPADKVIVVGAGYDEVLFAPGVKPTPDPVELLYAGKLCHAKGLPWLLQALSRIKTPSWRLHLIGGGSGEEHDACLRLAQALGDRVRSYGAIPQAKLAQCMQQAHIFILPSFFEGLPLVALEALACRCRIVANRLPGIAALIDQRMNDVVRLVALPRLYAIDRPLAADEKAYVLRLAQALQTQMESVVSCAPVDWRPIEKHLAGFRWQRVFRRVERVYQAVIRRRGNPCG